MRIWPCGGSLLTLFLALSVPTGGTVAEVPSVASPGEASQRTVIAERCPTFSWSAVAGAIGYELVVYRLSAKGEEPQEVLRKSLTGSINSWTPALGRCLAQGGEYAWSVRALGDGGTSDWSLPGLFEVVPEPTREELEQALEVVRTYLRSEGEVSGAPPLRREGASDSKASGPETVSRFQLLNSAALTVTGEVRTLDPGGQPRLWGQGRPGGVLYGVVGGFCSHNGVRFGLSRAMVDWASAAQACPAGSWVCTSAERGTQRCQTNRRAFQTVSYMGCDGVIVLPSVADHFGWLADNDGTHYPRARSESGGGVPTPEEACKGFAVWCCLD